MRLFSKIENSKDITDKEYVDALISGKANLSGGNTLTGTQILNNPSSGGYSINAAGYIKGSWLQASATSNKGANTGKVCVFDDNGWVYYRTPKEVIIDAECAVKYEVKKTIDFGASGALYIGKFNVYDTNITCEITSTTSVTYSGKLVIATQNYVIMEATVYGDAANTVAPNFFIKPSSASDPYIEVYFKPTSWSKNVVHIYGSAIAAEPTDVCTNVSSVPSTATLKPTNALDKKANLDTENTFTKNQYIGTGAWIGDPDGYVSIDNTTQGNPVLYITDGGYLSVDNGAGTAGQVLTSGGEGTAPTWTTPTKGTVTQVKVNGSTYSPNSAGLVDLGTISGGDSGRVMQIDINASAFTLFSANESGSFSGIFRTEIADNVNYILSVGDKTYSIIHIAGRTSITYKLTVDVNRLANITYSELTPLDGIVDVTPKTNYSTTLASTVAVSLVSNLDSSYSEDNTGVIISGVI